MVVVRFAVSRATSSLKFADPLVTCSGGSGCAGGAAVDAAAGAGSGGTSAVYSAWARGRSGTVTSSAALASLSNSDAALRFTTVFSIVVVAKELATEPLLTVIAEKSSGLFAFSASFTVSLAIAG